MKTNHVTIATKKYESGLWEADWTDLSGSPRVGRGDTELLAVIDLLVGIMYGPNDLLGRFMRDAIKGVKVKAQQVKT